MRTVTSFASLEARNNGLKSLLFTVISIPLLAAAMFTASPVWAVHVTDNMELDGDTAEQPEDLPGAGNDLREAVDDWNEVWDDCQNDPADCTPVFTNALRQTHVSDLETVGNAEATVFDGGIKDIHPISDWTCTTSPVQGKSDIRYAYGATYEEEGDLLVYIGGDRLTVTGTANFGVWLLQSPIGCVSDGGSTPFVGTHTDGDLLLVAEFDQGGSVSTIEVFRWSHGPDGLIETADDCLGGDGQPGDVDPDDCSLEGLPFASGLKCAAGNGTDVVCGITNDGVDEDGAGPLPPTPGVITTPWRPGGIGVNGFYEVGTNLTELIGEVGCFATAMIETRSSTSLTATLKDFVFLDLSTCGTLTVEKTTVGGSGTFSFGVTPTAGGPDTFDLAGGESRFFATVEPDTYTISETGLPVTPEWELTNMTCVGGTQGATTAVPSPTGGSVDVTIDLSDDVVCTFTNTFTPPPGAITIEKVCDSLDDGGETFDFALGGFGGSSTADCADGSVTLACGDSIGCEGLTAGDYTVNETVPTGWDLTGVTCVGGTTTCGAGETPHATITLAVVGDVTESSVATFTNTENAYLEICKLTEPPGTGGDFDFSGDLGVFALAHNECSEVFSVVPDTPYDVAEGPEVDFTLADISCDGVNWVDNLDGSVTITPDPGEGTADDPLTCTFTNTQNPGYIQICKATLPTGSLQSFTVNLMGPDSDLPVSASLLDTECDFGLGDGGQVDLTAGAGYSVSEDPAAGWDTVVACVGSGGAENPGNIDVAPNEEVVCTFTNTQRGTIRVEKVTDPDTSVQFFDFAGDLAGALGHGGALFTEVAPGTYSTTETVPAGWDLTSVVCDDGNSVGDVGTATATYNVEPGETVTCVFTNTIMRGTIIVEKQTLPDGSLEDFCFTTNYASEFCLTDGQQNNSGPLLPASEASDYSVAENAEAGWDLIDTTCTGVDGRTVPAGAIDLMPGETVTCVFTNREEGSITVEKQTLPDGSLQLFDFSGDVAGSLADGGSITVDVDPGQYTSTETVPAGWNLTDITCDDGDSSGAGATATFNVDPGEDVTCVFTNTEDGSITVEKQTLPDGSLQLFDFSGDVAGSLADGGSITVDVEPGQYTSTETVPAGWDLTDITCDDGDSSGAGATATFNVAPGEDVTCVFTNTQRGTIEVEKQTDPDGTGQTFDFTGDVAGNIGDGGVLSAEVPPGQYTSTETVPQLWDLIDITCDDGNSSGDVGSATATFNVEPGETVRCVFTNLGRATVTVEKIVEGGGNGEFCFNVVGPSPYGFCIDTVDSYGSETNPNVLAGNYSISEVSSGQYILVESFCDNGDDPANLSVNPGDDITCTFVNVLPVPVPVNNFWALLALTLMMLATGWYFRPASMRR